MNKVYSLVSSKKIIIKERSGIKNTKCAVGPKGKEEGPGKRLQEK